MAARRRPSTCPNPPLRPTLRGRRTVCAPQTPPLALFSLPPAFLIIAATPPAQGGGARPVFAAGRTRLPASPGGKKRPPAVGRAARDPHAALHFSRKNRAPLGCADCGPVFLMRLPTSPGGENDCLPRLTVPLLPLVHPLQKKHRQWSAACAQRFRWPATAWPCPGGGPGCCALSGWRRRAAGCSLRASGPVLFRRCLVSVSVPFRAWWVPGRSVRAAWASASFCAAAGVPGRQCRLPQRVPVWAVFQGPGPGPRSWLVVFPSGRPVVVVGRSVSVPGGSGSRSVAAWHQAWARWGGQSGLLASWPWPGGQPRWLPASAG